MNKTLVSYVSNISKYVVLLSTMHRYDVIDESDDKKNPEIIQFYNATMSSSYSIASKNNTWPKVVLYYVLHVDTLSTG